MMINFNIKNRFKKLGKGLILAALILSLSVLSACGRQNDSVVVVAGSTSVQPYAEVLAEKFMSLFPGSEIDIQGGGSSAGIMAAETGTADIGMSSRDLNDQERELWSVEIAKDGLAVIVHPDNPVQELTLQQIRDIYAAAVTDWGDLGGNAAKIHVITREEGSGTRSAFESMVMGDDRITPRAIVQDSNGAVRQLVSGDRNSIGFISLGLVNPAVKALRLDGVEATWENVLNNSYSLYRPFLFVAESQPAGLAGAYCDFVLSEEGQLYLAVEGLIPGTARNGKE